MSKYLEDTNKLLTKEKSYLLTNEELLTFIKLTTPNLLFDKVGYVLFYLSGYYSNTYGKLENYPAYLIEDGFVINDKTKDDMRSKSIVLQSDIKELWLLQQFEYIDDLKAKLDTDDLYEFLLEVSKQVDELSWASLVTTVKGFDCYKDCKEGNIPFMDQETIKLFFNGYYEF